MSEYLVFVPPYPQPIKICGITSLKDAQMATEAGAGLLGFIFVKRSKRFVDVDRASDILNKLYAWFNEQKLMRPQLKPIAVPFEAKDAKATAMWFSTYADSLKSALGANGCAPLTVGVFLDHSVEEMNSIAKSLNLDLIQLHGSEGFSIANRLCRPCIRVLHVDTATESADLVSKIVGGNVAFLLLDTKGGGTGTTFNWKVASSVASLYPILVAGGLSFDNVASAVSVTGAMGVDVCGGVEMIDTKSGKRVKNPEKVKSFVSAALTALTTKK